MRRREHLRPAVVRGSDAMKIAVACIVPALLVACSGDDPGAPPPAPICGAEMLRSGEATYYAADGSGNCSFDPTGDLMVAAMNELDYAVGGACGACAAIDGPSGSIVVRIVDRCPECPAGNIDLSAEAFAMIAEPIEGRVHIDWRYVTCDVTGPIVYASNADSNPWWLAIQIRNHRYRIAKVEARATGDSAFTELDRQEWNYFIAADGLGEGPFDFRVTDVYGGAVEDTAIALAPGAEANGAAQLPSCD